MTLRMKAIRQIAREYLPWFPGWLVSDEVGGLVRIGGAVLQGILFDRSGRDDYRPTGFIRVLTAAETAGAIIELPQCLVRPNGSQWIVEVRKRRHDVMSQHDREIKAIVHALYEQMQPRLDRPLNPYEVLTIYEDQAITRANSPEAYSLATLNAYLGYFDRTEFWCDRYRDQIRPIDSGRQNWETERLRFLEQVEEWICVGTIRTRLDDIIQIEMEKLQLRPN